MSKSFYEQITALTLERDFPVRVGDSFGLANTGSKSFYEQITALTLERDFPVRVGDSFGLAHTGNWRCAGGAGLVADVYRHGRP